MVVFWKIIISVLLLYTIAIDGNRARRRRRQTLLNPSSNPHNQMPLQQNPQGQPSSQQGGQNEIISGKQGGRQYYPYQGQTGYGYGSVQGLNYPYAGAGVGSYNYGSGQYGQQGQGLGGQYGAYYNQYPGSSSFYGGYNSAGYNSGGYNSYNRPGYSNYYPSSGSNMYGGYFWNAGQKHNVNMFTVFLSSILTCIICLITV
ncbi:unnamed protein product [Adineta steineri]|uniref:Uncharacterized protein n=1 Tax=Adineta steineri TaxID=433720 RepID=A0A814RXM3_9BILA|nr:unnamed protein product [Adineta steineri]